MFALDWFHADGHDPHGSTPVRLRTRKCFPVAPRKRNGEPCRYFRKVPCVDGSELARRFFTFASWSVQPCVRPGSAAHKALAITRSADQVPVAHAAARSDLAVMAKDLSAVVLSGAVKIELNQTYPLREAAQAHRDLESRKTVGSTVLVVS